MFDEVEFFFVTDITITIVTLFLNGTAVLLIISYKSLIQIKINRVILSLLLSDFLSGCLLGLDLYTSEIHAFVLLSCTSCRVYRVIVDVTRTLLVNATVLHLIGIAAERYVGLFHALRYHSLITCKRINIFLLALWSFHTMDMAVCNHRWYHCRGETSHRFHRSCLLVCVNNLFPYHSNRGTGCHLSENVCRH